MSDERASGGERGRWSSRRTTEVVPRAQVGELMMENELLRLTTMFEEIRVRRNAVAQIKPRPRHLELITLGMRNGLRAQSPEVASSHLPAGGHCGRGERSWPAGPTLSYQCILPVSRNRRVANMSQTHVRRALGKSVPVWLRQCRPRPRAA